ncbi:MAG: hypothetical protein NTU58_03515 [Candidatus Nealsonbacteria bacterium]|nr:hypothetical protein [Candidatus Nealsonbacteria bacterium]
MNKKQKENKNQVEVRAIIKEVFFVSKIRFALFLISIAFLSFFLALISGAIFFNFIALFLLFWILYSIRKFDRKLSLILKKIYSEEIESDIE